MKVITDFFNNLFKSFSSIKFEQLITADICVFFALFIVCLICCALSKRARAQSKRPFLYAVNVFTAITFSLLATAYGVSYAAATSAAFWSVGYLLYGLLSLFKAEQTPSRTGGGAAANRQRSLPQPVPVAASAVPSGVRLEHALSVADKLLLKNLGRGDRQELEKIKTSLTVLKVKGALTPQEGEQLNDMFNALLKLMAKYDV